MGPYSLQEVQKNLAKGHISNSDLAEDVESQLSLSVGELLRQESSAETTKILDKALAKEEKTVLVSSNHKAQESKDIESEPIWAEDEDEDEDEDGGSLPDELAQEKEKNDQPSSSEQYHLYNKEQELVGVANFEQLHAMAMNGSLYEGTASIWDKKRGTHLRVEDFAAAHHLPRPEKGKQKHTSDRTIKELQVEKELSKNKSLWLKSFTILLLLLTLFFISLFNQELKQTLLVSLGLEKKGLTQTKQEVFHRQQSKQSKSTKLQESAQKFKQVQEHSKRRRSVVKPSIVQNKPPQELKSQKKTQLMPETAQKALPSQEAKPQEKEKVGQSKKVQVMSKIALLNSYVGKEVFIGPLRFSEKVLASCAIRCELSFYDQQGDSIKAVFFTAAYTNLLEKRSNRVFIKARVAKGGKLLYLSKVLEREP